MFEKYNHGEIEERWQKSWLSTGLFKSTADTSKEKYYVLEMFPYPSGKIHMGHVRNYAIGDVTARYHMMRGKGVLHPMGWDSFGLPAENAAKERNIHPADWTRDNIDNMRRQLKRMGFAYDWELEVATCLPDYYRWNQWFFLKMFDKGLAYKKRSSVNWCPDCETVLANEQVEDGLCWRCESEVASKELDQWFLKTTEYAEELLEDTDKLTGWPEMVLAAQRNWIGKSVGAEIDFALEGTKVKLTVFTTRPDTLYGTTFMSLAPEHPLVAELTTVDKKSEVEAFVAKVKKDKSTMDYGAELPKEGVFIGAYSINPLTKERMPVFAANFVLMEYGTGAVMAVPAHDQRDFEFAKEYDLDIKVVINPSEPKGAELDPASMEEAYTEDGVMTASGKFDGENNREAIPGIIELLEREGAGKKSVNYKLRDWGISRQRYWGCPIPIVYCDKCGTVPLSLDSLPVLLPNDVDFSATGSASPLETSQEFLNTECPKCRCKAKRETDTMDTFVDSSWYFLRYLSPKLETAPFDKEDAAYWMPVDRYIGGIEHAVMHLLYARFFTKVVRDLGLIDFGEPFTNLLTQGMVCKETLKCTEHGYVYPEDAVTEKGKRICKECKATLEVGRVEKMSKSKKNVIDPDKIIERYGADTTRLFTLFASPPTKDLDWSEDGVEGSYRFLSRVWRLVTEHEDILKNTSAYGGGGELSSGTQKDIYRKTHETIQKVGKDIEERFHFNTAISASMELVNTLYLFKGTDSAFEDKIDRELFREAVEAVLLAEELWARIGMEGGVFANGWPKFNQDATIVDEIDVVVQINGKVRSKVSVPTGADKDAVESAVMNDEKIIKWLEGKEVRKFIYVPGKLANLVAN
jgi:leucyl-tRNA synthetase